jgi:predicted dehydrogenase
VKKIRVGVVGVGYLGQFHAEKYAKMEGVEVVGVVDVIPSRAKEIAKRTHTQPFFHHSELFKRAQAVSIAVPTAFHHAIAKDFFLHGIDVLLEKPISRTLEEADELISLAESKGLILQVGHLERFNGALRALEGLVQNPLFIDSHRLGPFTGRGADVNVVLDLMIHDIDIILNLVHSRLKELKAVGIPVITRHIDIANARIEFENGCTANLTASRVSKEKTRRTQIFQSDGILSIDYVSQRVSLSNRAGHQGKEEIPKIVTKEILAKKIDLLEAEIHSFLQSVRARKNVRVSGWDGKRALEVALQIIQKIDRLNEERAGLLNS